MIDSLDFTDFKTLLTSFLLLFLIVFLRYIILSGTYHWLFFVVFRKRFRDRILSTQNQNVDQIKRELLLSVWSAVIFSLIGLLLLVLWQKGYTKIYFDVFDYPLWYLPCSIMIFLLLHDSYYYWLHVWMHASKKIRRFHMDHHKSVDTTVFTSFSFHPLESLLQSLIIPLLFIIVPMSVIAVIIVLSIMTV